MPKVTTVANATMLIALQPVAVLLFFSKRFDEVVTRLDASFGGDDIDASLLLMHEVGFIPVENLVGRLELIFWNSQRRRIPFLK